MLICLEGNIGSGKSTCIDRLDAVRHTAIQQEPVHRWSHWLSGFYATGAGAFQLQTAVLMAYAPFRGQTLVCERSPATALHVFSRLLLEQGKLSVPELDLLQELYDAVGWEPDVVVYIDTPPSLCMERIRRRGRPGEQHVGLAYVEALRIGHERLLSWYRAAGKRVCVVDGTQPEDVIALRVKAIVTSSGS